jgi:hypothetical protein
VADFVSTWVDSLYPRLNHPIINEKSADTTKSAKTLTVTG